MTEEEARGVLGVHWRGTQQESDWNSTSFGHPNIRALVEWLESEAADVLAHQAHIFLRADRRLLDAQSDYGLVWEHIVVVGGCCKKCCVHYRGHHATGLLDDNGEEITDVDPTDP